MTMNTDATETRFCCFAKLFEKPGEKFELVAGSTWERLCQECRTGSTTLRDTQRRINERCRRVEENEREARAKGYPNLISMQHELAEPEDEPGPGG
jgi:hypothetical protein